MNRPPLPPSVTVVVVNYDGVDHLPTCLDSLARLDYPRDRHEVVVVDNGSTDGSRELLATRYPEVRVLAQTENLGFAAANNIAAEASSADCLALLNTDMAVDPGWLTELVAAYDPAEEYRCVASLIVDWSGERLDFADGVLTFYGMADQLDFGKPLGEVAIPASRDLLFACGGAMLVEREALRAVGGFDAEYFAYFEDVDLGWRLWLAGHRVRLAPKARARHRYHGTSGGMPWHQRQLLLERNSLRTLVKNLDERNLWPLLSAALLLLGERARIHMDSRREDYDLGWGAADPHETVRRDGVAAVHAVADLVQGFDRLMEQRAEVQALRRRTDEEIFERFRRPFLPMGPDSTSFLEAVVTLSRTLELGRIFERRRATHLVVVADGGREARHRELAAAMSPHIRVTLATSAPTDTEIPGVEVAKFGSTDELRRLVEEADVLLAHWDAVATHPSLATAAAVKIFDLPAPRPLGDADTPALEGGELFVSASEDERDTWLDTLRRPIDVVPSGEAVAPLVAVCEEPWRWTRLRDPGEPGPPTEDVQLLLARRRLQPPETRPGASMAEDPVPPRVRAAASRLWGRTPEALRARLRPALRRVQMRHRAGAG